MSPRNAGSVTPSRVSSFELRGLAYCPAIRPILMIGRLAPYVSTTAICRIVLILLRMLSAVASANVSAQSPPCSKNASPRPAAASRPLSTSASPANTSGGRVASRVVTRVTWSASGQVGCWATGSVRQWSNPATTWGSGTTAASDE